MPYIAILHIPDHTAGPAVIAAEIEVNAGARVVGIFEYPERKQLKCSGSCTRKGTSDWRRHPKGFIYCAICGSRNKRVRQWLTAHLFDLLGTNLYPEAPAVFRTPEGYGIIREQ